MPQITVPEDCYLHQLEAIGAHNGQKRWRCPRTKRLYEWDGLHGEIEVYNSRGLHLGVLNAKGEATKEAVKGRRIDV